MLGESDIWTISCLLSLVLIKYYLLFVVELVLQDVMISDTGAEWIECQSTDYVLTLYWVNGK
jgi:hypothetical protein